VDLHRFPAQNGGLVADGICHGLGFSLTVTVGVRSASQHRHTVGGPCRLQGSNVKTQPLHRPRATAKTLLFLAAFWAAGAAWACPDFALNGQALTVTATQLYKPQSVKVQAGGDVSLDACAKVPGAGQVAKRPDFTITYRGNGRMRLEFRVDSDCDAVLLINRPDGTWVFDDDSNGNADPKISIPAARDGLYDVWVGRLGSSSLCNATLTLETF